MDWYQQLMQLELLQQLVQQAVGVGPVVFRGDADERQQSLIDTPDGLAVDVDRGPADSLDQSSHGSLASLSIGMGR